MAEDRKQELKQLLHEALANLEIRQRSANRSRLPTIIGVDEYGRLLQQSWTSHSYNSQSVETYYKIHVTDETTKSKLLDFIRIEFAPSIHEDRIQSASFLICGSGIGGGWPLDYLLEQLLKITIVYGIERAVSDFDKCAQNTPGSFQYMALLHGIKIDTEIQIFEGIKLVPLSNSSSELPNYLPPQMGDGPLSVNFLSKVLLVIDASISPVFHKPFPEIFRGGYEKGHFPFQVEVNGKKFTDSGQDNFRSAICQALSLACNSAVEIPVKWQFLAADKLFNLNFSSVSGGTYRIDVASLPSQSKVTETEIVEAKRLYNLLINLDNGTFKKLQIPIDRWIKSKTSINPVDKIIDLGIALEALYLPKNKTDQLSLSLRLRASWHLGKNKSERKELIDEFDAIYTLRSKAVHNGELPPTVKIRKGNQNKPGKSVPTSEFIPRAQELCRDSILKILEDGKFLDDDYWNDLILGEE